jgi:hypothetical protein
MALGQARERADDSPGASRPTLQITGCPAAIDEHCLPDRTALRTLGGTRPGCCRGQASTGQAQGRATGFATEEESAKREIRSGIRRAWRAGQAAVRRPACAPASVALGKRFAPPPHAVSPRVESGPQSGEVDPPVGIEPPTFSLRVRCHEHQPCDDLEQRSCSVAGVVDGCSGSFGGTSGARSDAQDACATWLNGWCHVRPGQRSAPRQFLG